MHLERDLNAQQRAAVEHGDSPLLVLAGPGTGKTRVIIYRVAHLIESGRAEPHEILALTFTNRAAQELVNRVRELLGESIGGEVWVGTFHNACARILREDAEELGVAPDFAIFDQETQDAILVEALHHANLDGDPITVARLRSAISVQKTALKDPMRAVFAIADEDELDGIRPDLEDAYREAIAEYERRLKEYGAYDFDDLLRTTVERLRAHPAVLQRYQRRVRHVLVDEYQDINLTQYEFLRALTPPPYRIAVVGDEDQSIYSWRGSSPEWIRRFREDFEPRIVELEEHYRSTRTILHAAGELIAKNERVRETPLKTNNAAGYPLYLYALDTEEHADRITAQLIRDKLHRRAHIAYRDIAVFYRNHRHADRLEERLLRAQIPVQRVRPTRDVLDADESRVLAWLRYLHFGLDTHLASALTFPATVLDEWSRVWFEWKAHREGRSFLDVVTHPGEDVPPLTRLTLERTLRRMHALRERLVRGSASQAVQAFFEELERHRSPFHRAERERLLPWDAFPQLSDAADVLGMAVRRGDIPQIVSADDLDSVTAAVLLQNVLSVYFSVDARVHVASGETMPTLEDGRVMIGVGDLPIDAESGPRLIWLNAPVSAWGKALCPRPPEGMPPVGTWVAHRLCQRVLAIAEEPQNADIVVYDLETTGNNARRAEIIEFAGTRLGRTEEHRHLYIKPKRPIPPWLTRIHGIDDDTVRDKPSIEEQIRPIREFIGDAILVGHNIIEFDNRVLEREMEAHLREILRNASYDTYAVARRLFPHESHQLSALARRFGIEYTQLHRADHDVEVTKHLFHRLRREESSRRAQTSLPEYLPFVAIGAMAREAWEEDAFDPYRPAAARWLDAHDVRRNVLEALPSEYRVEARRRLDAALKRKPVNDEDDRQWGQMRSRFLRRVVQYEEMNPRARLADFLNLQALANPVDELDETADAVTLMTLHSAKGTEFRAVIMTAMEEGVLPAFRSIRNPDMLAEERRLCYVGMTRAKERLYFVAAEKRTGERPHEPSRFLKEIPSNLLRRWSPRRR